MFLVLLCLEKAQTVNVSFSNIGLQQFGVAAISIARSRGRNLRLPLIRVALVGVDALWHVAPAHLQEALPELLVLVAVDDEVEGGVDRREEVGQGHHGLHPAGPVGVHVKLWNNKSFDKTRYWAATELDTMNGSNLSWFGECL